jgi:hypothetical protein
MDRFVRRGAPPQESVDLTADDEPGPSTVDITGPERAGPSAVDITGPAPSQTAGRYRKLFLPGGLLDPQILGSVDYIAQQSNCIGCDGRGLAEGIAQTLPYGCTYKERRRQPPANKFAVPSDRATPGTIAVRRPPASLEKMPAVISMNAQWEMGAAGKYNRVKPPEGVPPDSASNREMWFQSCLDAISRLEPRIRSIAFPYEIGCSLAGGDWARYEAMISEFARQNPGIEVTVVKWTGGHARGRGGGGGSRDTCFKCGKAGHWASQCPSALPGGARPASAGRGRLK